MICAVERDFADYDRRMCAAASEREAIQKWADELYDDYVSPRAVEHDEPLPWIVDEIEEQLAQTPQFWQCVAACNWRGMQELKEEVILAIAEKYWDEELERRQSAQY